MRQAHALVKVMREVEQKKGRGIEDLTLGKMIDILGRLKAGKDSPIVFFPTCTENPEIKVERSIDPDGEVREEVIIR